MAFYLSPQIDVIEKDLSIIVPSVATSIGCIVIPKSVKGPVGENNKMLITSEQELYDNYGKPDSNSYEAWFAAKGYLKHGNKLWVARAMPSAATYAYLDVKPAVGATAVDGITIGTSSEPTIPTVGSDGEGLDLNDLDNYSFTASATSGLRLRIFARGPGVYGNSGQNIKVGICNYTAWQLNAASAVSAAANYPNYWGVEYGPTASDEFLVFVITTDQNSVDTVQEVWLVSTSATKKDHTGASMYCVDMINENSAYIAIACNSAQSNQPASVDTDWSLLGGGTNGGSVEDNMKLICYGYFDNPETIDVNMFIDANHSTTVKTYLNTVCQDTRKDAVAILDVPKLLCTSGTNKASRLVEWRHNTNSGLGSINSSYSALYGNWGYIYDRYNNKYRWIPLAGYVAGIYAHTDNVADPWFAPAGLNRGLLSTDILRVGFNPTLGYRDHLYVNGINPITEFRGQGIPIWGQKTLTSKPSSFDRVNVRRLFIVMEKAISTMAKWFLFEPNDNVSRRRFVSVVTPYLEDIKARRGVYDFRVICDTSNNTPSVIDRNEFVGDILVKPVRAAEFIILNFVALSTGASFTEYTAA